MYTIVSGTNRKGSNTSKVALHIQQLLKEKGVGATYFSLEDLPINMLNTGMYDGDKSKALVKIEEEVLKPTTKYIFVMPEYNGSIPGILKLLIDASEIPPCWYGKKAALIGIGAGRAGNLRGMEHFTGMLGHIHINTYWDRLPISGIGGELNDNGQLYKEATLKALDRVLDGFIGF